MRRLVLSLGLALATTSASARADDASDVAASVAASLGRGATREAIETCESFADRGGLHPDISFDRGLAYLDRVRAGAETPGDLGRAAAAFEETRWLRPGDPDAERALELVRAEVARRRARGGVPMEVDEGPSAWRAVVGLLPEDVWALLAGGASLVLALGLALRLARTPRVRLAAGVALGLGLVVLALTAPLAAVARHVRRTTGTAVVVVPDARLLDEHGGPTTVPPIPEAARVDVLERRGALAHIRWGTASGFTAGSNVRVVRPPAP